MAERDGCAVVEPEVRPDQVPLFVSAPPRWSSAELVNVLKNLSVKQWCKECPKLREAMWGGELWSRGYFVSGPPAMR